MTIDPDLLPRLTVVLGVVALVVLAYALWREYRRRPTKPIAVDHDHNHHGLIWTLARLHRPDKPEMSEPNQLQLTERPIEVALRKAGRRVPPSRSGRPWDRPPVGFAGAIQDALEETEQMAKEPWRDEVDYVPDLARLPPATDKRVARAGDRAIRNAQYFDLVTRHLLSAVTHETGEHEGHEDNDKAGLAEQIRRRFFEVLVPKVRQIGDMESRAWAEVEFGGLPPGSPDTPSP